MSDCGAERGTMANPVLCASRPTYMRCTPPLTRTRHTHPAPPATIRGRQAPRTHTPQRTAAHLSGCLPHAETAAGAAGEWGGGGDRGLWYPCWCVGRLRAVLYSTVFCSVLPCSTVFYSTPAQPPPPVAMAQYCVDRTTAQLWVVLPLHPLYPVHTPYLQYPYPKQDCWTLSTCTTHLPLPME